MLFAGICSRKFDSSENFGVAVGPENCPLAAGATKGQRLSSLRWKGGSLDLDTNNKLRRESLLHLFWQKPN